MNIIDTELMTAARNYHNGFAYSMEPCTEVLVDMSRPQPGEHVVDIAAGTGFVARKVSPRVGPPGRVVAVDPNAAMLAFGRSMPAPAGGQIEWLEGSAESLPLDDGTFDLALCQHGLQYFSDCIAAFREMRRVLKPGGRVAVSTWRGLEHNPSAGLIWRTTARYLGRPVDDLTKAFSRRDPAEMRRMMESAGLSQVQVTPRDITVRQPHNSHLVADIIAGARRLIPELDRLSDKERQALAAQVNDEIAPEMQQFVRDDWLVAPFSINVGTGFRPLHSSPIPPS